jgi:hypothetical protein
MIKPLELKESYKLGNAVFKFYALISLVLLILSITTITDSKQLACNVFTHLAFIFMSLNRKIRTLPGMILIMFTFILYAEFPVYYFGLNIQNFNFDTIIAIPQDKYTYIETSPRAIFTFVILHLLTIGGMYIGNLRTKSIAETIKQERKFKSINLSRIKLPVLFLVGILVFAVSSNDVLNMFAARSIQDAKQENFLALLLNDKMYQLIFPVIFYQLVTKLDSAKAKWHFIIIFGCFLAVNMLGTSKASLLVVFSSFFIYPLTLYYTSSKKIYWPSNTFLLIGIIISIPLFFISMVQRELVSNNMNVSFLLLFDQFNAITSSDNVWNLADILMFRLSVNLNNFILIFHHFEHFDINYSIHFGTYIMHSFTNLILPGSPFPNSYELSSQLLPAVLTKATLGSNLDKAGFLAQANTQPYTIYGVSLIIIGKVTTYLLSFLGGIIFSYLYKRSGWLEKAIFLFIFLVFYNSYGFDTALQFIIMTVVTTYIIVFAMKFFSRKKFILQKNAISIQ